MKFYIAVEESRSTVVEVEANNKSEAIRKVDDAYAEGRVCLDSEEFVEDGVRIFDETKEWERDIKRGYETNFLKI